MDMIDILQRCQSVAANEQLQVSDGAAQQKLRVTELLANVLSVSKH